jgi:hypothetical protein
VRGSDPGLYDNVAQLQKCYTLTVQRRKASEEGGQPVLAPRTPSWCDRVLSHSISPEQAARLRLRSYSLCDALKASDHVSNLPINTSELPGTFKI